MNNESTCSLENYIKYNDDASLPTKVFLSYQSNSKNEVIKLSNTLENNGINTWYAPRDIDAGEKWEKKIVEAIKKCKALLLLFTKDADKSNHVYREVNIADMFHKPILWIKLDFSSPDNLIYYLSSIQWYDSKDFTKLCDLLKSTNLTNELKENSLINTYKPSFKVDSSWCKGIYAFDTPEEAAECAARVYFLMAQKNKNKTILLPTGRSAKKVFVEMIKLLPYYKNNPFGKNYLINDTETINVNYTDKTSRIKAINDNLVNILNSTKHKIKDKYLQYFGFYKDNINPIDHAKNQLLKFPPLVYGISVSPYMEIIGYCNGDHDDSIINDKPKMIKITNETLNYIDNRQEFDMIYTIGLKAAFDTKLLMILAFDDNIQNSLDIEVSKSNAIKRLFTGDMTTTVPLTLLRKHKNAFTIITKEIAKKAGILDLAVSNFTPLEAAECITKNI